MLRGKGGAGVLSVDGQKVARTSLKHGTPITLPVDEGFDIGQDTRTGVAMLEYRYDLRAISTNWLSNSSRSSNGTDTLLASSHGKPVWSG
jgi:hypothetical protein